MSRLSLFALVLALLWVGYRLVTATVGLIAAGGPALWLYTIVCGVVAGIAIAMAQEKR